VQLALRSSSRISRVLRRRLSFFIARLDAGVVYGLRN
jgi:hypothetical protein